MGFGKIFHLVSIILYIYVICAGYGSTSIDINDKYVVNTKGKIELLNLSNSPKLSPI